MEIYNRSRYVNNRDDKKHTENPVEESVLTHMGQILKGTVTCTKPDVCTTNRFASKDIGECVAIHIAKYSHVNMAVYK